MKNLKSRALVIFVTILASFLTITCAHEPIKVDLSADHPANPQSPEAAFIPPPNPFAIDVPTKENQTGSSYGMTGEKQKSTHHHQMSPKTDKIEHESKSSHVPETQDTEHHHKEHNQ